MAEALSYIINIVWAWKLTNNKDGKDVSPITDSQTVQAQACTDINFRFSPCIITVSPFYWSTKCTWLYKT